MRPYLGFRPPLPPGAYLRPKRALPYPLDDERCGLFARARIGLWHAARGLGLGRGDEILVPPYHHGSEIEALVRTGATCRYYRQGPSLDPEGLEELIGSATRALYLIHYLGFPADAAKWRAWCDERGLLLIEDAAMAWLSTSNGRPVGSDGDAAIFCMYKSVGVPDGGAVIAPAIQPPAPSSRPRGGLRKLVTGHAQWVGGRTAWLGAVPRRMARIRPFSTETEFGLGDPAAPPSGATVRLVPRLAGPEVPERRLANYRVLLARMGERVPLPFVDPPDGASPYLFPIRVDDRERVQARLADQGVIAVRLWSHPHPSLSVPGHPAAAELRASVLGLPVHQELRPRDLDLIAGAVDSALRSA